MSEQNSFLVFSGTNTRYLAEKICQSLGCPLGNLVVTGSLTASLPCLMRNQSVAATYFSFRAHSLTQTTSWSFS